MACYQPLRAFEIGVTKNGKKKYKICGSWVEAVLHDSLTDKWIPSGRRDQYEYEYKKDDEVKVIKDNTNLRNSRYDLQYTNYIEVSCGKCAGCREQQAKEWTDRIIMELQSSKSAYFVTLTYEDTFLPYIGYTDENGVITDIPTLKYRDIQLFLKRLRADGQEIRYFCAGEYGELNHRPHYHMIIFNLKLDDLTLYKNNFQGDPMYNSEYLEKMWKKGFVVIGEVNTATAGYTARYVLKKYETAAYDYKKYGLEPEFSRASKRPALGREFMEAHVLDFANYSNVPVYTADGVSMVSLPKYGKRLYKAADLCQDIFESKTSENQEIIREQRKQERELTDLDYRDELAVKERKKRAVHKALLRDL